MFESLQGELRIRVVEDTLPDGWWGAYDLPTNTIHLRRRLAPLQRRSTLAHEIAHAVLGHDGHHPRHERQAEELAASWLNRPADFSHACRVYDTATALAHELNVLPRDVRAYVRGLERARRLA